MKRMRVSRPLVVSLLVLVVGALLLPIAREAEGDNIRRKAQAQEKARALAGELVGSVLEIQMRQLEENGLKGLPIYKDIASMKGNIGELMKEDMEKVVQILVAAQEGTQKDRLAKFNEARGIIREVVVKLMAERQKLYRRMQIAKLAAQVRELIAIETKTMKTTASLPERKTEERERLTLTTIEDQADVQKLYYQLVATLEDVSTWGGQIGAGASDGIRILKAAQVSQELKNASGFLTKGDFPATVKSQELVIVGLKRLLEKLEETQGLIESDREAAIRMVREMLKKQEALRELTKKTDLATPKADELAKQQQQIHEELGKVAEALQKFETTQPLLEQAKQAAYEAPKELFEQKKEAALESQNEVIGALAKVEQQLQQGTDLDQTNKSADELAAKVKQLEEAKKTLEQAAKEQAQANANAEKAPAQAKAAEDKAAAELAKVDAMKDLPAAVESKVNDAQEAVAEAAKADENAAPAAAENRKEEAEDAKDAINQAKAEVEAALADAKRQQKAVQVGELARAAEALERAAAAEKQIAKEAAEAAKDKG